MPLRSSSPYLPAVLEGKSGILIFQGNVSIASPYTSHQLLSIQYLGISCLSSYCPSRVLWKPLTLPLYTDIAMLSVPLYLIWSLQTSFRRKVGISAVFGTGALYVSPPRDVASQLTSFSACACSLVRIFFEIKITRSKDFSYVHMETGLLG